MNWILLAIGAGLASALLYLAVTAGTLLAIPLFYLSALPIMLAGLGWGTSAGWVAAIVGIAVAGTTLAPAIGGIYAIACGLPAAFITRQAMLGRPIDEADPNSPVEWYPEGRILLWCAAFGAALALAFMGFVDFDMNALAAMFHKMITETQGAAMPMPAGIDPKIMASILADMVPRAIAALWTASIAINLWLAARITNASGRLKRPMPVLADIQVPPIGAAVVAVGIPLGFLGGAVGIIGVVFTTAFATTYAFIGLITLHVITRDKPMRPLILGGIYMGLIVATGWFGLVIAVLGLADSIFFLRRKVLGAGNNPSNNNPNSNKGD